MYGRSVEEERIWRFDEMEGDIESLKKQVSDLAAAYDALRAAIDELRITNADLSESECPTSS